jgi:signal transduction histidine kinase
LEVQPLVDDLNGLLEDREKAVKRAQATAGDLAHGLKTPLAILAQEAERAEAAGNTELAHGIGQQVDRMRRQVDYHLARARAAGSGASPSARCFVAASAEGLARTMLRLHGERNLAIDVQVDAHHVVRVQREDLDEMLGNLLDNACKWGRSKVRVSSKQVDGFVEIRVDDDGPGIAKELRSIVMQRGVRADESELGSGLGLAIVRDLVEVYGGSVELQDSAVGGVLAVLKVPAA